MLDVWLGMKKVNGNYEWDDGTSLDFLGWQSGNMIYLTYLISEI